MGQLASKFRQARLARAFFIGPPDERITAEALRGLLDYDAVTGLFRWRHGGKGVKASRLAGGAHSKGYWRIKVGEKFHFAHRLAWLYVTGNWPSGVIDHINGDRRDNRFANLRDVTVQENVQNTRKARPNNKLGILGVHRSGQQFVASISIDGVNRRIGTFDTPDKAHDAYVQVKRAVHSGCTI